MGSDAGQDDPDRGCPGKLLSPARRRRCIDHVRQTLGVSERRACRTLGQHRSTQRKMPLGLPDEERLTEDIIELTREFGRYGYRMITGMLNNSGWHVNHKRPSRQICFANRLPGNGRADLAAGGAESPPETTQEGSTLAEPLSDIASQCPAGQWTGRVSGFGRIARTMSPSRACKHALPGSGIL